MSIRNLLLAIYCQLTREGALRNIFVTHNAWGIFSKYSHTSRRNGRPKMAYPDREAAQKATESMSQKHGVHFSVYKCAWCDGWHVGKNAQNKIAVGAPACLPDALSTLPNSLYDNLKHLPIVDLAPVLGRGVRGRTMSGRGSRWLLDEVRKGGVKVIIDLRTADRTDRYDHNVKEAGLHYHSIPIDSSKTDVHSIIASLPLLFRLMDEGAFYMACAMGRHRTDIAIALYYVFHPSVPLEHVPEMRGHRKDGQFRCDDIAARLNSVMKSLMAEEMQALALSQGYEAEYGRRKKLLFELNRKF